MTVRSVKSHPVLDPSPHHHSPAPNSCGEWAHTFLLLLRAAGLAARHVYDHADHVWVEFFSDHLVRWVHVDPCEAAFDTVRFVFVGVGVGVRMRVGGGGGRGGCCRMESNPPTEAPTNRPNACPDVIVRSPFCTTKGGARSRLWWCLLERWAPPMSQGEAVVWGCRMANQAVDTHL